MALSSTIRNFEIELANIDQHVYESLAFKVAQHPSEHNERVAVRVLARALAHEEGLEFGRGLSTVEDPALWLKDPMGQIVHWIDVGAPAAQRLHKANKQAQRVSVYSDKNKTNLQNEWRGQKIHQADAIALVHLDTAFIATLGEHMDKQNKWSVTLTEGYLSVGFGDQTTDCQLEVSTVGALI